MAIIQKKGMLNMKSQSAINDKILQEINNLDAEEKLKKFLNDILMVELDIMDMDKGPYVNQYKSILDSIL